MPSLFDSDAALAFGARLGDKIGVMAGDSDWEPAQPSTCSHPKTYYTERGERCRACGKILRPITDFKGKPEKRKK